VLPGGRQTARLALPQSYCPQPTNLPTVTHTQTVWCRRTKLGGPGHTSQMRQYTSRGPLPPPPGPGPPPAGQPIPRIEACPPACFGDDTRDEHRVQNTFADLGEDRSAKRVLRTQIAGHYTSSDDFSTASPGAAVGHRAVRNPRHGRPASMASANPVGAALGRAGEEDGTAKEEQGESPSSQSWTQRHRTRSCPRSRFDAYQLDEGIYEPLDRPPSHQSVANA